MKVLGLDAATTMCGAAIVDDDRVLCDYRVNSGFAHAEHLLKIVDRALGDLNLGLKDLDGLALTIGPGLFTGLRIAVSTAKGILAGTSTPVVPVSTLEALAWNVPQARHPVCPILDAKKEEVYAALFSFEESGELKRLMEDQIITPEALSERLPGPVFLLGDGAARYKEQLLGKLGRSARFVPSAQSACMASVVAQIGLNRLKRGEGILPERLEPVYLRRLGPEVKLKKKQGERSERS